MVPINWKCIARLRGRLVLCRVGNYLMDEEQVPFRGSQVEIRGRRSWGPSLDDKHSYLTRIRATEVETGK